MNEYIMDDKLDKSKIDDNNSSDDDWEYATVNIVNIIEQKKLMERKLVEESDAELSKDLFEDNINTISKINAINGVNTINMNNKKRTTPIIKTNTNIDNKDQLMKQKRQRYKELADKYGESELDNYDEFSIDMEIKLTNK
jgi:hypothetical protein